MDGQHQIYRDIYAGPQLNQLMKACIARCEKYRQNFMHNAAAAGILVVPAGVFKAEIRAPLERFESFLQGKVVNFIHTKGNELNSGGIPTQESLDAQEIDGIVNVLIQEATNQWATIEKDMFKDNPETGLEEPHQLLNLFFHDPEADAAPEMD